MSSEALRSHPKAAIQVHPKIGDYHDGEYETKWVSPITKSAHNVDSPLFLVLHDWWADRGNWPISGAFDSRSAARGYGTTPSDTRLQTLLNATYGKSYEDVFITNLWPFVKPRDGDPPSPDYDRAFRDYCWRQIEILAPQLVVCLGKPVRDTFSKCLGGQLRDVGMHFRRDGIEIWGQSHPGDRANHATEADMLTAWAEMRDAVELRWTERA